MMNQPTMDKFIDTSDELAEYRKNLPEFTQLRAISATSFMRTFGDIVFAWDPDEDYVLIVPYNLKFSHEKKEKMDISENPASLAIRALLTEGGLDASSEPYQIGEPIESNNTDSEIDLEHFYKYVMAITRFRGALRNEDQVLADKNGVPVWIKRYLLFEIFEEIVEVKGRDREHPQLEAFRKFDDYALAYLNLR